MLPTLDVVDSLLHWTLWTLLLFAWMLRTLLHIVARSVMSHPVAVIHWMRVDCLLIVVDWMCLPEMYIVINVLWTGCVHSCWHAIASLFKVLIRLLGMLTDAPLELNQMSNAPVIGNVSQNTTEKAGMHFATLVLDTLRSMGTASLKSF